MFNAGRFSMTRQQEGVDLTGTPGRRNWCSLAGVAALAVLMVVSYLYIVGGEAHRSLKIGAVLGAGALVIGFIIWALSLPGNQLSGVTELRQRRNSQYQDLHIDIPPPADFFVQESPPPSYEASSFTKPVVTPPPTYSAAVDLTGSPPVWNVPAAVHQTVTPQLPLDDGTASPRAHPTRAAAEEPRHHSSAGCD